MKERREMKEGEKNNHYFMCYYVISILYVLCVKWSNLMLCVILCFTVCALFSAFDVA